LEKRPAPPSGAFALSVLTNFPAMAREEIRFAMRLGIHVGAGLSQAHDIRHTRILSIRFNEEE